MSRIVKAVNAMILNRDRLKSIAKHDSLIWFVFDKHKWSIAESGGHYFLAYYPGDIEITELLKHDPEDPEQGPIGVYYNTKEIATREALQSFKELYAICNEKMYDMDKVFDDIIGKVNPEDEPPF
jgi:hypothetical protein